MAVLDIGCGSLEVTFGRGRVPDFAVSLPLGANHLTTKFFLTDDPPPPEQMKALPRGVRHELRDVAARIRWENPTTVAVTSRTFQQPARLCGAAPGRQGPFVDRGMDRTHLRAAIDTLAEMPAAERHRLPGISAPRARQSLADALIGHTAMKLMVLKAVAVCPWAVREGVLLRCIEDGPRWWDTTPDSTPAGPRRSLHLAHDVA